MTSVDEPICPRCGYLLDRFLNRRISAQVKLNRLYIIVLMVVQLAVLIIMEVGVRRADRARADIIRLMQAQLDRGVAGRNLIIGKLEDIERGQCAK